MSDWREPGRADNIWRGALLTSCLVHLCLVSGGWLMLNRQSQLPQLRRAIQVALIAPQPAATPAAAVVTVPAVVEKPPPQGSPIKPLPAPMPVKEIVKKPLPEMVPLVEKSPPVMEKISPPKPIQPVKKQPVIQKVVKPKVQPKTRPVVQPAPLTAAKVNPVRESTQAVLPPATQTPMPETFSTQARSESNTSAVMPVVTVAEYSSVETNLQSLRDSFLALLRDRIERYKKYPLMARKGRQQGSVLVQFELAADGALRKCFVKESCGYRLLDRAALRAVKAASPFPSVPAEIKLAESKFIVPVRFVLSAR